MSRRVTEQEFADAIRHAITPNLSGVRSVTGPMRSGAIASVYASHLLGIPFVPYGEPVPEKLWPVLVIDTARKTGASLRKAARRTGAPIEQCVMVAVFDEPPRLRFWYERP